MKNIFLIIFLIPLLINCQTEKAVSKYPTHVGNIEFDEKLDDPTFKRCGENEYAYQYYHASESGIPFAGEKLDIIRKLEKENIVSSESVNGYITVRFVVNCEGKSGIFRIQEMDENYTEKKLDKTLSDQLLTFTKRLKGWLPTTIEGKKIDYYQYITYKIENGKVSEILP